MYTDSDLDLRPQKKKKENEQICGNPDLQYDFDFYLCFAQLGLYPYISSYTYTCLDTYIWICYFHSKIESVPFDLRFVDLFNYFLFRL